MVQEAKSVAAAFPQAVAAARTTVYAALPARPNDAEPGVRAHPAGQSVALRLSRDYARLQETKDAANQAAIGDRQRLAQLDEAQRLLREMRAHLTAIVKNYPPFPLESAERQRYLEMVAGLRKQMEALIFPPPDKWGPPPLPGARTDWLPPTLDARASDPAVAQALETIGQLEAKVQGYGSEIRAAWQNLPMPAEQASRLSEALGKQLAAQASSIGGGGAG